MGTDCNAFLQKSHVTCEFLGFWHGVSSLEMDLARKHVGCLILRASRGKDANISIFKVSTDP